MSNSSVKRWVPALLRASSEVVAVVDAEGELIPSDSRLRELLGITAEADGRPLHFGQFFPDVDLNTTTQGSSDFIPVQVRRTDGVRAWVLLKSVELPPPDRGQHLLLIQEPSAVRRIVDRLNVVEDFDPATGLFSRNRGQQQLKQLVASGTPGCCLLITLNPAQAHRLTRPGIDSLLQRIVAVCQAVPGLEPTVARNGEAELLVLSLHPERLASAETVQGLKAAIAAAVAAHQAQVQVQTGFCHWSSEAPNATAILEAALSNQLGGDGSDQREHHAANRRALLQAIEAGQLVFHIEPQVRASDGALQGGELLVRWQHPEQGMVLPGQFIHHLEHPSCAPAFIRWSIDAALQLAVELRTRLGDWFPLSLNLSGSAFRDNLLTLLRDRAAQVGLPPAMLELEITERLIAERADEATACLRELRAAGFRIAVDDFGTGYSSLAYIRNFPLDRLKIDRSFVMGIAESEEDRLITTAIISLSHVLDLGVVVEGVESLEQAQILRELGAETLQGYLFSHPLPLEGFVQLVQESRQEGGGLDLRSLGEQRLLREEPVVWKRSYSTDVVSIDDQHRHLIDLLNRLTASLRQSPENLDVALALQHLAEEARQHFQHEEQVMANIHYDRLDLHRHKHQELLAEFSERRYALLRQFDQGEFLDLIAYLKFWLLHHLMSEDTRLHRFLNQPNSAAAGD